ncbi:hypothetical protein GGF37_000675 [Kickxella alabastrina]|nr:hypothetical protein GGF37_000675 [Kickxella alabastrina]
MVFGALRYLQRRLVWRHLPILVAGVLAGYLVGSNKPIIRHSLISSIDHPPHAPDIVSVAVAVAVAEAYGAHQAAPPETFSRAMAEKAPINSTRPVRAAIVALVRNSDLFGLRLAIRQIEDRFNRKFQYPYIFVNDEPFTEEFKQGVRDLTRARVDFGLLDEESWAVPEWIDKARYAEVKRTAKYPHGEKDSYRKMCRFQSGFLHKHPLLADLEYYWRIEPDVEYFCDIDYDPFLFMRQNGIKYGWNIAMTEFMDTVATLWNTTMAFVQENPQMIAKRSMRNWLVDANGAYNGCHFWSNFEIFDLSLYLGEAYESYFKHLDNAQGFFYERWGDAPIHSIAASLLLQKGEIHWFEDIGYKHPGNMHCPRDKAMLSKCICNPDKAYTYRSACQTRFARVNNMSKERMVEIMQSSENSYLEPPIPDDAVPKL